MIEFFVGFENFEEISQNLAEKSANVNNSFSIRAHGKF